MSGARWIRLVAAASLVVALGATDSRSLGPMAASATPPSTSRASTGPTSDDSVSTVQASRGSASSKPAATTFADVIGGRWMSRADARAGSTADTRLRLWAVEPLHDVAVTVTTSGPVAVDGPDTVTVGHLTRGGQVVTVPVTVSGQGIGNLHASVEGVEAGGHAVAGEYDLAFAGDGTTVTFSPSGMIVARTTLLDLHRESLTPSAYGQQLAAIQGGGATVRVVTSASTDHPNSLLGNTTVSGTIDYTDVDSAVHPSRDVTVEIVDADGAAGGGTVITSVITDSSGGYSASVPTSRTDGTARELFIRVLAEEPGIYQVHGAPASAGAPTPVQYMDSTVTELGRTGQPPVTATGAPVEIDMTANNDSIDFPNDTAFAVADAVVTAGRYSSHIGPAAGGRADLLTNLNVEYPTCANQSQYTAQPTCPGFGSASGSNPTIQIQGLDTFAWDVILHQYGMWVGSSLGISIVPTEPQAFGKDDSALYSPPSLLLGTEQAWADGFADFVALAAEQFDDVSALDIPDTAAGDYIDVGTGTNVNFAADDNPASAGQDDEASVGRTLWQLFTTVGMDDTAIIQALAANLDSGQQTLTAAVPILLSADNSVPFSEDSQADVPQAEVADSFACVLTDQAVAPTIAGPVNDSVVQTDTPPVVSWSTAGAGEANPLTQFYVEYWSGNWDKLLATSPLQTTVEGPTLTYEPTPQEWKSILGTTDAAGILPSSLHVVVQGSSLTGTGTGSLPPTGPYDSCAITLQVDRSTAEITSPTAPGGGLLGISTGLSSDGYTAVVGAPGACDGYISASAGCEPGTVSFWSLDPGSGIWTQTASFQPGDLGLTGCSDVSCPGAVVLGDKVTMSGDGTVAAASLAVDPTFTFADPGTWSIEVATFVLENGAWVSAGEPSSGLTGASLPPGVLDTGIDDSGGSGSASYPHEAIALDGSGNELLVADPNRQNTILEAASTAENFIESLGEVYEFARLGTTSFTYTGAIADPNVDPHVGKSSPACSDTGNQGECTSWNETFGESIALSGNGEVAVVSDDDDFDSSDSPDFSVNESADIFTGSEGIDGSIDWSPTPDDVTGADVESQYIAEDDGVECATSPHCQYEDFGAGMALDENGDTAFVGDPTHDNDGGAVYVFHNTPNPAVPDFAQVAELNSTESNVKGLGWSLASSANGQDVVAGAPGATVGGQSDAGKAELFTEPASGWTDENQVSDYTAPDGAPDDLFGSSVGISADGSTTFASAPGGVAGSANEATYAGAAYSFVGATVTTTSLTAPDLTPLDGGGVQGTTGETTDLTAKVDPVPSSGSVAFSGPSGPISGCEAVAVDPDTGSADCTVDLSETDTITNGTSAPDEYSAVFSGSGPFASSTSTSLEVTVVPLLTIFPTTLPTITAGSAQDLTVGLTPVGGIGPLTWSVVTGAGDDLPATMSLTSSGEFDGSIATPGAYSFTAQVTDASPASQTADEDLTWVVVASGQPTLSITPATPPVGVVGSTYPVTTLKVTGGSGGTTWSATGLPSDFTLTPGGQLEATEGAPTVAGSYPIGITATQTSQTATYSTTLVVDAAAAAVPAAPILVTATLSDPAQGEATLSWAPPVDTGAGPITNYYVTTSGGQENLPVELTGPPAGTVVPTQYVVHEMKPGVSETFTVVAANAYGDGPASSPSNAVVGQGITEAGDVSATSTSASGTATATVPGLDVSATGYGIGTVTVGDYADNPEGGLADGQTFVDVSTGPGSSFTQVVVTVCGGSQPGGLDWWNATAAAWQPVTPQGSSGGDCTTATISATSSPTLSQLDGTPFALLSDGFPVVAGQGDSDTATSASSSGSAVASTVDGAVSATGQGAGTVTVFDSPGSNGVGPNLTDGETYANLSTASSSAFGSVDLDVCGPVVPTGLVWWDNSLSAWQQFSDPVVVSGDCATATVSSSTTPSLSQLKGQISLALEQATPVPANQAPGGWASDVGIGQSGERGGFGTVVAVAADDSTALVTADGGSAFTQDGGASASPGNRGSVEVLTSTGTGWVPSAMIVPPTAGTADSATGDFGEALAVSADGTTALIAGTVSDQTTGTVTDAVWVMHESGGVWSEEAELDPPAGDAGYPNEGANAPWFGSGGLALSADGTVAMVDQTGYGAVVFADVGGTWSQQAVLQGGLGAQAGTDKVGASAAMSTDGQTIAVGADDVAGPTPTGCARPDAGEGAVYFYSDSGGTWALQSTFQHDNCSQTGDSCASSEFIGFSVALSGDGNSAFVASDCAVPTNSQAVSLEPGSSVLFGTSSGVYVLTTANHWATEPTPVAALSAPEAQQQDYVGRQFGQTGGSSGAVSGLSANGNGSEVLVADSQDSVPACSGCSAGAPDLNAAWVFQDVGGTWAARSALRASTNSGWYGTDLSLSADGSVAGVSDINVQDSTSTPGGIYLFGVGVGPGDAPPGPTIGSLPELVPGPAAPTVTAVSPGSGAGTGGTTVTVTGTGFSGANGVLFGGTPVTDYTIDSDTQITVTAPPGTGTVDVEVGRGGNVSGTSGADRYTYSTGTGTSPLDVIGPSLTTDYGGQVPTLTPTYQGFVNGDTASSLTAPATCTTTATSSSPPATYPVICSGATDADYSISYTAGSITVAPAPLTVRAPSPTMGYGGQVPSLTPTYQGFVNGDTASSLTTPATCTTTATSSSPPASYPVTCSGGVDADYAVSYDAGSITVGAAPLTVVAPSLALAQGDAIPVLTPTYQGFVNGDTVSSLTTPATCTTTATSTSPPAAYPVTCSGATDADYSISYTAGSITVTGASPQAISFHPPPTGTVGTSLTLSATGGASGLPVVFTVDPTSGSGVCSVSGDNGSDLAFDGSGSCVVDANQGGNANFAAAPQDQGTIVVTSPAPPTTAPSARAGYWLVAADGGVFAYGDAPFYGSGTDLHLDQPVVGMAATPDGKGYWLVAADGGVFAYGDAPFDGSTGSTNLDRPIVGIVADQAGDGYWLSAGGGGVFPFGGAPALGDQGGRALNRPVVGVGG